MRPIRIIIALLLGLITTVALAWTAMFVPHRNEIYGPPATTSLGLVKTSDEMRIFQLDEGRNLWHHQVQYWHMQVSGMSIMIPLEDYEARKFDLNSLPNHLRPGQVDEINMMAWYREVGFPMPALTCSIHWRTQIRNADIVYDVKRGIQLPRDKDFTPRALPLMPLWPGFVVDVLVWSLPWFALLWGVSGIRAWQRARRGRCRNCGYLLTGLAEGARCPECGEVAIE